MPCQLLKIDRHIWRKKNVNYVLCGIARVWFDFENVLFGPDQPFGKEKSKGEFLVVSRRSHCDAKGMIIDADFQRFFAGQVIGGAGNPAIFPAENFLGRNV